MTTQPPRALTVELAPAGASILTERVRGDRRLVAVERAAGLRVLCCYSERQAEEERRSLEARAGHGQRCFLDVRGDQLFVDLEGDDASRAVAYEVLADLCAAGVVESMHDMDSGEALDMHRLCPRLAPTTESR